jgi:deoxycytidylate deaminase
VEPNGVETDEHFMHLALDEARAAAERGEVPVGAVLVDADRRLLAGAGNRIIAGNVVSIRKRGFLFETKARERRKSGAYVGT